MYKLVIEDEEGSKSVVPIIRDEITIGREEGNTIRLTERNVSRQHARVVREDGRVYIEDVAARYGIKKNGAKIDERAEFGPGDIVAIGDYHLTLKAKKPEKPAGATDPSVADEPTQVTARTKAKNKKKKQDEGTQVLPAMPAKLVVISSNFAGQEFPLKHKEMIIGRGEDCDIIIDHRSVSQKHAKVIREPGSKYQIVDLNSKNGVSVGGEQYRAVHIKRGDVIELGHVKFRFVEAGENYVFTPQPELDEFTVDSSKSGQNNTTKIVGIVLAAILAGAAIYYFMSGDEQPSPSEDTKVAQNTAAGDNAAAPAAPANTADDSSDNAAGEDDGDDKVAQAIKEAGRYIHDGKLDRAIGSLESARKYLEPSPEQNDRIDDLMRSAKRERPFKQDYQAAKDLMQSDEYLAALERLGEIPDHSIFYQLYQKEGLLEQAIDGVVVEAEDALAKEEVDQARSLAEEALVYDDDHEGARALLERIEDDSAREVAMKEPEPNTGSRSSSDSSSRPSQTRPERVEKPEPKKEKPEPKRGVSREEAKALYASAQKKIFRNDPTGAINDCKKALQGGNAACYRILAIAYKQQGNSGQACSYFKRYLNTNPRNASAVQREMEKLGCQ